MKKLTIITPTYPPHVGGVEKICFKEKEMLENIGWEVNVITSNQGSFMNKTNFGYKIIRLRSFNFKNQIIVNPFSLFNIIKKCNSLIYHIHTFTSPIAILSMIFLILTRKKFILTPHYHPAKFHKYPLVVSFLEKISSFLVKKADLVFVITQYEKERISKIININKDKVIILPWGCEPLDRSFVPLPRSQRKFFLFVGRLSHNKGIEILMEVFKALPEEFKLLIVGPDTEGYSSLIKKIPNIEYLGYLEENEIEDLYKKSIALILPSKYEAFGLVALESLRWGTPVILSENVMSNELIISNKCGFVYKNVKELCNLIEFFYNLKDKEYEEFTKRCISLANQYSWEHIFKKFDQILSEKYDL
jgi:glycosyltransferase involved in cell wall biosynthesis